jgi:hypothetical protein
MSFPPTSAPMGGAMSIPTRTANSSGAVTVADGTVLMGTAAVNIQTLPPAASVKGSVFTFKKVMNNANNATVKASGSELIDGSASIDLMAQYEVVSVQSNGVSYDVLYRG